MNLFFNSKCRRQGMHSGNKAKDRGKGKDKREAVGYGLPRVRVWIKLYPYLQGQQQGRRR